VVLLLMCGFSVLNVRLWLFSQTRLGPGPRQQGRQVQAVRKSGSESQPEAGGSEYLELHGAFSISLRAPGTESLSRFGYLAWRAAQELLLGLRGIPVEIGRL
jgi:hypothetical protein